MVRQSRELIDDTCTSGAPVLISEFNSRRAIALESVTFQSRPFSAGATHGLSTDGQTRLLLFARNIELQPPDDISVVTAQAVDAQGRSFPLVVESVRKVPAVNWLTQVVVKLPLELAQAGDVRVQLSVRGIATNKTFIKITP